tara:strand:- start:660 stop:827 length:168 start_codon:yes stop_codon:yes gene_type:complete
MVFTVPTKLRLIVCQRKWGSNIGLIELIMAKVLCFMVEGFAESQEFQTLKVDIFI